MFGLTINSIWYGSFNFNMQEGTWKGWWRTTQTCHANQTLRLDSRNNAAASESTSAQSLALKAIYSTVPSTELKTLLEKESSFFRCWTVDTKHHIASAQSLIQLKHSTKALLSWDQKYKCHGVRLLYNLHLWCTTMPQNGIVYELLAPSHVRTEWLGIVPRCTFAKNNKNKTFTCWQNFFSIVHHRSKLKMFLKPSFF
jgi:hypothetical protein